VDVNTKAFRIVRASTAETNEKGGESRSETARVSERVSERIGGQARAKNTSGERRKEIASMGGLDRRKGKRA
jgi:hypothetical protein